MHSSRMRTGRSLTVCRGVAAPGVGSAPEGSALGVSAPGGCLLPGKVSAPGGSDPEGSPPGGGGGPSASYTPL